MSKNGNYVDKPADKPIVKCNKHAETNTSCCLTQREDSPSDRDRCSWSQGSSNSSQFGSNEHSDWETESNSCDTRCTWCTCTCEYRTCNYQNSSVFSSPPSSILIKITEPIQDETLRKHIDCQTSGYDLNFKTADYEDKQELTNEDNGNTICKLFDLNRKQNCTPCRCGEQKKDILDIKIPERKSRDIEKTRQCSSNIPLIREHHIKENKEDTSNLLKCTVRIVGKQKDQAQNENKATKQRDSATDKESKTLIDVEVQNSRLFTKAEKAHSQNKIDNLTETCACAPTGRRVEALKNIFETSPKTYCTNKSKIPIDIQKHKETSTCDKFKQIGVKKEERIESCPRAKLTLVDVKCWVEKLTFFKLNDSEKEDKETNTDKKGDVDSFEKNEEKQTQTEIKCVQKSTQIRSDKTMMMKTTQTKCKREKGSNTPIGLVDTSDESTQTRCICKIDKETETKEFEQKTTDESVVKQNAAKKTDAKITDESGKKLDTKEPKQETPEQPLEKQDDWWFSNWLDWLLSKKPDSDFTKEDSRKTPDTMKPEQKPPKIPAVKINDVKKHAEPIPDVKKSDGIKESFKSVKENDQTEKKTENFFEIPKDRRCEIRDKNNELRKPENDNEKRFCKIYNGNYCEDVDLKLTTSEINQFIKEMEYLSAKIEAAENEKTRMNKKKPKQQTSTQSQFDKRKKYIREDGVDTRFLTPSELDLFLGRKKKS